MGKFPYEDRFPVNRALPDSGRPRDEVLAELRAMATEEDAFWETGKCSGTMYCGDHEHYDFMNEAFGLFAHVNVLQRDMCPSATKFEAEILAMALDLLHAEAVTDGDIRRERVRELLDDRAELDALLARGAAKAREIAARTLATVYERVGFLAAE